MNFEVPDLATQSKKKVIKGLVTEVGFEPTPPKRLVPETSALDRSAIQPGTRKETGTTEAPLWDRT